ncbi:MAG: elongation factor P [Patescibacteria group bacterium]
MLTINDIKNGIVIQLQGDPYIVTKFEHHKAARGGATLKTKLRNLRTGALLDRTFQGGEKIEEGNTEKKKVNFMYEDEDNAYFMDYESYDQFDLPISQIKEKEKYLKEGTDVTMLYFEGDPIAVELPIKMDFEVTSAPPAVKGNSADNVNKQVEIETGAKINAPMFVKQGDIIRVNTETGEYVERVKN